MPSDTAGSAAAHESETLTSELLERLLASATPEAYLDTTTLEGRGLHEFLLELLEQKKLTRSQVIRASGINGTFCYQLFQGARHPSRDTALMLSLGMNCDLQETQRILRLSGHAELWPRKSRDAIIIFCIEHGLSREQTDDELFRFGEKTLLDGGEG
ncbi:MAG: XRE family transcriptional regulator [Atopobiaceae bacterium]|nr:XRE family transcriptional regulator [Atopobiaceae bacterium]